MQRDGDQFEVLTEPSGFSAVCEALEKAEIATLSAELSLLPMAPTPIADASVASSVFRFIEALEDNDDVQNVYANMDVDDAVLAELSNE